MEKDARLALERSQMLEHRCVQSRQYDELGQQLAFESQCYRAECEKASAEIAALERRAMLKQQTESRRHDALEQQLALEHQRYDALEPQLALEHQRYRAECEQCAAAQREVGALERRMTLELASRVEFEELYAASQREVGTLEHRAALEHRSARAAEKEQEVLERQLTLELQATRDGNRRLEQNARHDARRLEQAMEVDTCNRCEELQQRGEVREGRLRDALRLARDCEAECRRQREETAQASQSIHRATREASTLRVELAAVSHEFALAIESVHQQEEETEWAEELTESSAILRHQLSEARRELREVRDVPAPVAPPPGLDTIPVGPRISTIGGGNREEPFDDALTQIRARLQALELHAQETQVFRVRHDSGSGSDNFGFVDLSVDRSAVRVDGQGGGKSSSSSRFPSVEPEPAAAAAAATAAAASVEPEPGAATAAATPAAAAAGQTMGHQRRGPRGGAAARKRRDNRGGGPFEDSTSGGA